MKKNTRFEHLTGFEISTCHVRSRNIIGFCAQKWLNDDSLEQRETAVFFYYPDEPPADQWGMRSVGEAVGIHGCASFKPAERWVLVLSDGEVYVTGQGDDDFEDPISKQKRFFFSNVKSIRNGHAISVGVRRAVFLRKSSNKWVQLDKGLFPQGEKTNLDHAGFSDVDGFSETDIYACGGHGDLWHYDGRMWTQVEAPTDAVLKRICCADDESVYITTNRRDVLRGRGQAWEVIQQDVTKEVLEEIVCYKGKVIISTKSKLFTIESNKFKAADLGIPKMKSKAHLAEGDGILVVAGSDEAAMFDGKSWSIILEPEK